MRKATCCLLVVLFGSWSSSLGQSAPKFSTPRIVATFERLRQTGEIPSTTIYTPKHWGTFRVSTVMVGIVGNGQQYSYWDSAIQFIDGAGKNPPTYYPFVTELNTNAQQTTYGEYIIRANAGKPITFSVKSFGVTEGSKYNVWVVVEQLM